MDTGEKSVSIIVVFRILRLLRLLRLVRLFRFFKPLWLMACGIVFALRTACWAWTLIGLLVYIYGLCLTRIMAPHLCGISTTVDGTSDADLAELNEYFGDIFRSMFSVFQVVTAEDWNTLEQLAGKYEPSVFILFAMILGSTTWGVMHVIIAVFVENAVNQSTIRAADIVKKESREYEDACRKLCEVFYRADTNFDKTLSKEEFVVVLEQRDVREKLRAIGIDGAHATELFDILDLDGSQSLDGLEFVEGVLRSRGPAQSKDVIQTRCDVWRVEISIETEIERASQFILERVKQTMERVDDLREAARPVLQCASETLRRKAEREMQMSAKSCVQAMRPLASTVDLPPAENGAHSGSGHSSPASNTATPCSHPAPAASRGRAASQAAAGSGGRGGAANLTSAADSATSTADSVPAPVPMPEVIPKCPSSHLELMPPETCDEVVPFDAETPQAGTNTLDLDVMSDQDLETMERSLKRPGTFTAPRSPQP
eukprot:gnl/TRDRNA2_/TRDRNA2_89946_c0_seq1.p1 gnl/TRDRNA2_/TRDRNA2_89946_c0~~gnl/TRDRNA2_/TRDRNA2_89946_c0_seq1.p1  ORF type:complete len:545 (-),score=68.24 gnl/TRDRNA2_/TRDRNA2_89946_c0_seq1:95-1555(-)